MKVLALLGSPRKGGNSEVLLNSFLKGVEHEGGTVELIRLYDLDIKPCIGCGGCDKTGECVLEGDDMIPLYDKIIAVKRIVFASPIYFYGIPAPAKAFVDRTQALWNRKRLLQEKGEWQDDPDRKGFFLSVAATKGVKVFEGAVLTMKYAFDAMGITYDGDLLIRGIEHRGDMKRAEQYLQAAEEAGRKFMR